jgi:dynein heavy chain
MKMLPITMFDDSEFEIHSLSTWVSHRAPGRALRGQEWSPCVVVGLDDDGERLVVEWNDDRTKATIHRLGICFDSEDPVSHVNRLEHCMRSRKLAESCIRYNLYIDCMPAEELGGLAAEQVNRVLSRAMSTPSMRENEFDTSTLLNEINVDYSRTMNKIIFDANMSVPENKHIAETLTLPPPEVNKQIVPEKGVVAVTQYDLEERFKSFVFGTFLVQPEVVYVLERVQQQCNKILDMRLFNTWVILALSLLFFFYFFFSSSFFSSLFSSLTFGFLSFFLFPSLPK